MPRVIDDSQFQSDTIIRECIDACIDQDLKSNMIQLLNCTLNEHFDFLMRESNKIANLISTCEITDETELRNHIINQITIDDVTEQDQLHMILFYKNYQHMVDKRKYDYIILQKHLSKYIEHIVHWDMKNIIKQFTQLLIDKNVAKLSIILYMKMDSQFKNTLATKYLKKHMKNTILCFKSNRRFLHIDHFYYPDLKQCLHSPKHPHVNKKEYVDDKTMYQLINQIDFKTIARPVDQLFNHIQFPRYSEIVIFDTKICSYRNKYTEEKYLLDNILEAFYVHGINITSLHLRDYPPQYLSKFPLRDSSFQYLQKLKILDTHLCENLSIDTFREIVKLQDLCNLNIYVNPSEDQKPYDEMLNEWNKNTNGARVSKYTWRW